MIFDKLCDMADAWLHPIRPMLEHAYVIRADIIPHQVLARRWPLEQLSRIAREFRLPHPVTAIEDAASCVVLADTDEHASGLASDRLFIECIPSDPLVSPKPYGDPLDVRLSIAEVCATMPAETVTISIGRFRSPAQREGSFGVLGELGMVMIGTRRHLVFTSDEYRSLSGEQAFGLLASALKNAMTAVEELIHIAAGPGFAGWPPAEVRSPSTQVRRSGQRPVFVARRECFGEEEP